MQRRPSRHDSGLDQVRIREGKERCRAVFQKIYERDLRRAVALLNDRRLTFPSLYILSSQIETRLYPYLRERLVVGLGLIDRVRGSADAQDGKRPCKGKTEHGALRWILDTGHGEDGSDETYEEVMECAVSVLINTYRDTEILPLVADMIFARHREGRNIHDLTWAYFRSGHPNALKLIARRLGSEEASDRAFACGLLRIDAPDNEAVDCQEQYHPYLRWLRHNDPYLYFTGESMQYTSAPDYVRVDPERKYVQRGTASYHKKPITPANEKERRLLEVFAALSDEEKGFLAEYSHEFHGKDAMAWKRWIERPVEEQIHTAKAEGEGSI